MGYSRAVSIPVVVDGGLAADVVAGADRQEAGAQGEEGVVVDLDPEALGLRPHHRQHRQHRHTHRLPPPHLVHTEREDSSVVCTVHMGKCFCRKQISFSVIQSTDGK